MVDKNLFSIKEFQNLSTLENLTNKEAVTLLSEMIDYDSEFGKLVFSEKAITLSNTLLKRNLSSEIKSVLYYCLANAWDNMQYYKYNSPSWDNIAVANQILCFRKSLLEEGAARLPLLHYLRICTNLGNTLSKTGRFLEAIEYYDKALFRSANFGMALGGKAIALIDYANLLVRGEERVYLYLYAQELLQKATQVDSTESHALKVFKKYLERLPNFLRGEKLKNPPQKYIYVPESQDKEDCFRKWCLEYGLILNPINLVTDYRSIKDITHTPEITTSIDSKIPNYFAYFNQLKQEFSSARFLCFEAIYEIYKKHYSDKYNFLVNSLDSALWDYHTEQMKLAFLTAYSILDKIAHYINEYFDLQHPLDKINFRNIWYIECKIKYTKNFKPTLLPFFQKSQNRALLALFWLSKDFCYDNNQKNCIEPEAEKLNQIRNNLEHHFFQIRISNYTDSSIPGIGFQSFQDKTIRLLQLIHHALSYLALAITYDSNEDMSDKKSDKLAVPMLLEDWSLH